MTDAIPVALTVIASSIALGLQPVPAAAEIIPFSVSGSSGSGALTIPGATYNVPNSALESAGLQRVISGSQNLGGFFTTPGFCLWAGACIPSTETGASVSAGITGRAGMTLDGSLRDSILHYSLGANGQAVAGRTLDGSRGTLALGPVTHDNQFNTGQLDLSVGAGIGTSLSIGGSARACIVSACTGASGNLFTFSAELRDIVEVVTDGANERINANVLGLTIFGVDSPFDLATLYYVPPAAFNTIGGFVVGSAQAYSSDDTTGAAGTTMHLEDSSRMPILGVSWNVIPFGSVGVGCCGSVPIVGGTLTAASDELVVSVDLMRRDTLDTTFHNFAYFDEPIELFHDSLPLGTRAAGQRFDITPAPVCVWGGACTPGTDPGVFEFRPTNGASTLHGHLAPELDGVFRELTSLAPCGAFDLTVGELSLTLAGQTFGVGPLYEHRFDLGCLNLELPLSDQSLRFTVAGAIQDFQVDIPVPGSLGLLGLGLAGLSLIRRRKTGSIPGRILPT